jgi:DNA integrity scanning protein DisA with diadenylate cyclase activity
MGEINQFTVRRRNNADDRVIVYQTPPLNSFGSQTISPGGYLIPEDMTRIQKENVNTIINQLKSQNAIVPDSTQGPANNGFTAI